jgi:FKBP-type peptidyl-prolyl cis-trans isomerase (trigger factor)
MAALNRLEDGVLEITMTIPWDEVRKEYEEHVVEAVKTAELPGFRKGKAPREMVEKGLDTSKVYEEVIRHIIPRHYDKAITDLKIRPIMYPKLDLRQAEPDKDWVVVARTCEKPEVKIGDYTSKIKDLNASKKKKIWIPGADGKTDHKDEKDTKPSLDDLLNAVMEVIEISLPSILIEEEVNRMLSELIDQTKKLGLSVEQYLASTNRTADTIKSEYNNQAQRTLSMEFALEEIAEKQNITVSDQDIQATILQAKSEQEKESLSKQKYYVASILRRRKTLDYLASL